MVETAVAKPRVGAPCTWVDPTGRMHDALITAVHGPVTEEERKALWAQHVEKGVATQEQADRNCSVSLMVPSVNLVFVVSDEAKTDSYGRQIERATSVPHESTQTAHGYKYLLRQE